jgi:hypothetical protein
MASMFDAHDRAFAFFKGACTRGIYDNMKMAVDAIFVGKNRAYNRRFLQMCGHYLVDPVACTPASGWEKGQVESQVGTVRQRFFSPRLRVKSFEELNTLLIDKCIAWAKANRHPEMTDRTVWEVFEAERPQLVPYAGRFDGFHSVPAAVSKTCLVRFDNNKYSVMASAVGRPVEIRAYAERIEIRQDGRLVADHPRCFGRGRTIYDPWHYVPVLMRKPGALRNGAPFKDWVLPGAMEKVRRKLKGIDDGDRQMVDILAAVVTEGLTAVEAACAEAILQGVHSADVILNILARRRDPAPPPLLLTSPALRLVHEPVADCARLMTCCGGLDDGACRDPCCDGRPQALRHAGSLRRTDGHGRPAAARTPEGGQRSIGRRDQREEGTIRQIPDHRRQAALRPRDRRVHF